MLVHKYNRIIEKFIWNGHKPKIKMNVLQCKTREGGLKLSNLSMRDVSLKIQWVTRVHSIYPVVTKLAYYLIRPLVNNQFFWACNFSPQDMPNVCEAEGFWLSVVQAWALYNYHEPLTKGCIKKQIIWLNSHIRIEDRPVYFENAYDKGIIFLEDILKESRLMQYNEIVELYGMDAMSWLQYYSLVSAIPISWKCAFKENGNEGLYESKYEIIMGMVKCSKNVYDQLISNGDTLMPKAAFWERKLNIELQCSPDNLTLANSHGPLNSHACSGHNSLPLIKM